MPPGKEQDISELVKTLSAHNAALEQRTDALQSLESTVRENTETVLALSAEVKQRPTRQAVEYRRRTAIFTLFLFGMGLIFLHDRQIYDCSPGARTARAFTVVLSAPEVHSKKPKDQLALERKFNSSFNSAPSYCDIVIPTDTHDGSKYPSQGNLWGWFLFAGIILSLFAWMRRPLNWSKQRQENDSKL